MKSTRQIETRRQRLFEKAKKAMLSRLVQREMKKQTPTMSKVMKWQNKSAKYVNRGLYVRVCIFHKV